MDCRHIHFRGNIRRQAVQQGTDANGRLTQLDLLLINRAAEHLKAIEYLRILRCIAILLRQHEGLAMTNHPAFPDQQTKHGANQQSDHDCQYYLPGHGHIGFSWKTLSGRSGPRASINNLRCHQAGGRLSDAQYGNDKIYFMNNVSAQRHHD